MLYTRNWFVSVGTVLDFLEQDFPSLKILVVSRFSGGFLGPSSILDKDIFSILVLADARPILSTRISTIR